MEQYNNISLNIDLNELFPIKSLSYVIFVNILMIPRKDFTETKNVSPERGKYDLIRGISLFMRVKGEG